MPPQPPAVQMPPACCAFHRALRVVLRLPPRRCCLCRRPATHRALTVDIDDRTCGAAPHGRFYLDVCARCRRLPHLELRLDAVVHRRN